MFGAWGKALDPSSGINLLQLRALDWDMDGTSSYITCAAFRCCNCMLLHVNARSYPTCAGCVSVSSSYLSLLVHVKVVCLLSLSGRIFYYGT